MFQHNSHILQDISDRLLLKDILHSYSIMSMNVHLVKDNTIYRNCSICDLIKGKYYTNCHNTFWEKCNVSYIHNNIPSNVVDK